MQPRLLLKRYWRNKKNIFFILLSSLFFLFFLFFFDRIFRVEIIEIIDSNKIALNGIKNLKKRNLVLLSGEKTSTEIINLNPQIKTVQVKKIFPNKLQLLIEAYKPVAYFKVNDGYFLLSDDGRIILKKKEAKDNLPIINYYQQLNYSSFNCGSKLDYKDLLAALHFLKTAIDLDLKINTIDINSLNMIALNLKDKKIFFTTNKDEKFQDYEFQTVIRQLKIDKRSFTILDLRFDKPVIKVTRSESYE